jgi:hypothetical protein
MSGILGNCRKCDEPGLCVNLGDLCVEYIFNAEAAEEDAEGCRDLTH